MAQWPDTPGTRASGKTGATPGLLRRFCQLRLDRMLCTGPQPDSGGRCQTQTCFLTSLMCKTLVQVAAGGRRQRQTTHGSPCSRNPQLDVGEKVTQGAILKSQKSRWLKRGRAVEWLRRESDGGTCMAHVAGPLMRGVSRQARGVPTYELQQDLPLLFGATREELVPSAQKSTTIATPWK